MAVTFKVEEKSITLKDQIPLRDANQLPKMLMECEKGDLRDQVRVMMKVIESWEFPGSPQDSTSYEGMDIFSELTPISKQVIAFLLEKLSVNVESEKN
jgi:hypothetical protein